MTSASTPGEGPAPGPPARADRRVLWWLALAPVICACSARDLWAPDEPRYGQVAREMVARGDWLVPHVNGEPYAEKPPLYWWGVSAISLVPGEVTSVTARLGGALYAFGCVFLLAWLVRRWFGDGPTAVTAAAMFSSAVFVAWVSQRAALDLPLTFFVLLAIERGEVWLATGRLLPAVACGAAWAGAILVKGPLGFLFPPMALAAGALARHRVPTWRNPGWLLAPGVMAGVGLAWLLPALDAGGGAYADRLLGQIAGRATGGEGHHVRPFYYFIERFPVITMPWSLHLLAGLGAMLTLRRAPHAHRGGLATCAALAIGAFVMLSAFATKREVYLVPVLPFMAAAAAQALHRGHFRALARWGVLLLVGTPVGLALVLLGLPVLVERVQGGAWPDAAEIRWGLYAGIAPACVAFLAGAWWTLRARREPLHAVRRGAMAVTVGMTVLTLFVLPALDRYKSYAPAARAAEAAAAGGTIYNAGFGQAANLLWSLDREISPEVHDPAELGTRLPRGGPVGAAVVGQGWWDRWRAAHPAAATWLREVWREPVDHRGLLVLTNRPAPTGGG